ncbi:MAG TPA: MerR family DNA-binding protein, partial [Gaiellaceae bacterium]|nr:MerR family DNA-binding protein [Gaiellaceae bacterium]
PLVDVRAALDSLPRGKAPTKRDWERLSRSWRRELDARIDTLQALRDRLTTCIGCGCLSLRTCALLNPADEAAALGGGAHYLRRVSPRGRDLA